MKKEKRLFPKQLNFNFKRKYHYKYNNEIGLYAGIDDKNKRSY